MTRHADWPTEGRIITIALTKCVLQLSEAEMLKLLANEPTIWEAGLKRGKAYRRAQAMLERGYRR